MGDLLKQLLTKITAEIVFRILAPLIVALIPVALAIWASPLAGVVLAVGIVSAAATVALVNQVPLLGRRKQVRELLEFDQRQRQRWMSYVHLDLLRVDCSHVNDASPSVRLTLSIRNFLLVPLKLVKVLNSEGTVGPHVLRGLPENYDVEVRSCGEHVFEVNVPLYGQVPDHLRSEAMAQCPRPLRWAFKGQWYVEVYGQVQPAWTRSREITCECIPNVPK